jgi:hypothetical protein
MEVLYRSTGAEGEEIKKDHRRSLKIGEQKVQ